MEFDLKKIVIYAIAPALIAGAFAIAPKLYDIFTEPRAELIYETTIGPGVVTGTQHKQIAAVTVTNSGKRRLSEVTASITPQRGKIETFQMQAESQLKPSSKTIDNQVVAEVPNPNSWEHSWPGHQYL